LRAEQALEGCAIAAMDADAAAAREVTADRIARHRLAAARDLREQVADALDGEAAADAGAR
jgi:hypothetical protein